MQTSRFFWMRPAVVSLGTLIVAVVVSANADAQSTVWGLRSGDRFIVNVFAVKQTEVTVGESKPVTSDTRDRFEIEYRVLEVLNNSDVLLAARLRRSVRETGESSPATLKIASQAKSVLEDVRIRFQIDPAGQISALDPLEREAVVSTLAGADPVSVRLFHNACPEEVITDWFDRPFWTAADPADSDHQIPERSDSLSLGPFGTIRTQVTIAARPPEGSRPEFSVSGRGRFVPLVLPESIDSRKPVLLTDIVAELDEYSGKVSADGPVPDEEPDDLPRSPPFHSLELRIRFHGSGMFRMSENAVPQKLDFRQTQVQSWILTSHSPGRSEAPLGIPALPNAR